MRAQPDEQTADGALGWGPSHPHLPPPQPRGCGLRALAWLLGIVVFGLEALAFLLPGMHGGPLAQLFHDLLPWAVGLGLAVVLVRVSLARPRNASAQAGEGDGLRALTHASGGAIAIGEGAQLSLAGRVRARCARLGGGAYLGLADDGAWVAADPEHAVMVLGPPRSGKTSAIVIPSILAAPGPVVSTATKRDVMDATRHARGEVGEVWLFDPAGEHEQWPEGVRRLCWSPVPAAATWDGALLMARAMTAAAEPGKGTAHEGHWRERSSALLAPLLHAAHLSDRPVGQLLGWVLRGELDEPRKTLEDSGAQTAADVLAGIVRTDERERSSILSATAGVLVAYNADAARRNSAHPNFEPERFVCSSDTVYITAPAHKQALCAPLVVGLLEQIRHATYKHAPALVAQGRPSVYMALDEAANIAPVHDLPALVSEAGGQRLHVLIGLQDLTQARKRWGDSAADGFLSLFQTKVILDGIADPKTLEAVSLALGEYDRRLASETIGRTEADVIFLLKTRHPSSDSHGVSEVVPFVVEVRGGGRV